MSRTSTIVATQVRSSRARWARQLRRALASTTAVVLVFGATQALSQPAPPTPAPGPTPLPAPAAPAAPPTEPKTPVAPPDPTKADGAPTDAKAPPAQPTPAGESTPGTPGVEPLIPRPREKVPGPPNPTPEQLEALRMLQEEAERYEADAKDYRQTLNRVIKHHYEEKRRTLLVALDREIDTETQGLKAARDEAIKELEAFIAKYSGPSADPKSTPDAMFRLAALYEERAREISDEVMVNPGDPPPEPDLSEAIALYKRIINEFPKYDELAAVFYYLGHAYSDVGQLAAGQQVWRSLVCRNHFPYPVPPDPSDPSLDSIRALPQDHEQEWWFTWMGRHGEPIDIARDKGKEPNRDDEEVFEDPYPDDCERVAQNLKEGEDPRYVAEVWWRLGDYHFEEIDPKGGPYNLNRAESAYRQSMKLEKPPVYGVAMYKLAWTFYKQQRYEAAVKQFVELLHYTDEQERLTGNPGADFRAEAYAYIAGSLTYIDFEGPGPDDPFIARNDIFDIEPDASVIEQKMRIAIDRVQDPNLVPQDKEWTIEIYKALAFEFKEYNHYHNLIELDELMLAKWPMHRDAPYVQNQIAEVYETLAQQTQGDERARYQKLALEARGKLVNYVATPGNIPPWVEANKEDPEAIRAAERLVRGGLRRAAADHTNAGRAYIQQATNAPDDAAAQEAFEAALDEYRLAARAWGGYLLQDENADDAYESRFWLADAHTNIVTIQIAIGRDPSAEEIDLARRFARDVRDSNEDEKYLQPAAIMVVRIAQQLVQREYDKFEASGGSAGFEKREELKEIGEGDDSSYVKEPVPARLEELVEAFDEYIARVPVESEPNQEKPNHYRFAYLSGEIPFLYGQFEKARARLYPIYQTQCGKTEFGYLAWEKLFTMANKDNDVAESRKLAEATKKKSCAFDEAQKVAEGNMATEAIKRGYYQEAAAAYKAAEAMPEGPEKKKAWRKAAELYEAALKEAPERKEAPEAAIYGAIAYKKIGEYDKAIPMYELFIKEYGSEERLKVLEKGDPAKGIKPNKKDYDERITNLKIAYDALAEAYVLFFDYERAAQTYDRVAAIDRFEDKDQRTAAQNAVFLYANTGQRDKVEAAKQRFFKMNPTAEEKAEIEWLVASADLKQWDATGPNTGANGQARQRALTAMEGYYRRFQNDRAADRYTVQAAYWASRLNRVAQSARGAAEWCDKAIAEFTDFKANAGKDDKGNNKAIGGIEGDMAAECAYRELDAEIAKDHDYESGHHRFKGVITDVREQFKDCVEEDAKKYFDKLQGVITTFESYKWTVAARARQGSLYDSCRTGLYNAREPELKLYNAQEDKLLKQLDDLCVNQGSDDACTKYDTFTAKRRMDWRQSRDQDLAAADKVMVRAYVEAIQWGKHWKVRVDATDYAIGRLAFYTEIIGDQKLREFLDGVKERPTKDAPNFVYRDGMFMRMRRGMTTKSSTDILPSPLPALPKQ